MKQAQYNFMSLPQKSYVGLGNRATGAVVGDKDISFIIFRSIRTNTRLVSKIRVLVYKLF